MLFQFIEKRPVLSAVIGILVFLVWELPEWLGTVWPLVSNKPLPELFAERRWVFSTHVFGWLTVGIGIVLIVLFILILRSVNEQKKGTARLVSQSETSVEFFEDRDALNTRTGGLSTELEMVRRGWVIWPSAGTTVSVTDERLLNIEKLILLNPNAFTIEYAKTFKAEGADIVSNTIRSLTQRAQRLHLPVRWYTYPPYVSIVIHDQASDAAWARVELLLPGIQAGHRPSIVIRKSVHPKSFKRLVEMYEYVWNESRVPFN